MKTLALALLLVAAAFGASGAWAVTANIGPAGTAWVPGANGSFMRADSPMTALLQGRTWATGTSSSAAATFTDVSSIAARGGALAATTTGTISLSNGAAAVARCLVGGGPAICGVASAAAAVYSIYRVARPETGSGLTADPGVNPDTGMGVCVTAASTGNMPAQCAATAQAACNLRAAQAATPYPQNAPYTGTMGIGGNATFCYVYTTAQGYPGGYFSAATSGTSAGNFTTCPASIDPTNSAYNVPAGSPVGIDGKCPTARYNHMAVTVAQAVAKVVANAPSFPSAPWKDAIRDAVDTGAETVPATIVTTGPASQVGPETVTTTTTGTPAVTTTRTSSDTYTYTYAGDTITTNTTNTTTINNGGDITTIVTNAPPPDTQDPADPCTANPTRVGCAQIGTPPVAEAIPNTDVPISYTPTIFASNASCPSPIPMSFTVSGTAQAHELSFQPMCDLMTLLRPLFLAFGAATAAMIFMAGLKDL